MSKLKKIKGAILLIVLFLFILAGVISVFQKNWIALLISFVGLVSVLIPSFIERRFSVDFAEGLEIIVLLFIYSYFYLGEYFEFFYKIWWWDLLLHGIGLFLIGLMSFSIIYILNKKRTAVYLSPVFVALFGFSFALSIGVLWEIFEFFMDCFFNLHMQKSGLMDTMGDLIIGAFGAFFASLLGFVYLKRKKFLFYKFFKNLIKSVG